MHRALRIFIAVIFLTASFPVPTVSAVGVAAPYPVQTDPNYHVTWDYDYGGGFQHIAQDGEEIFFLRGPYLVHQRIIVPTHLGDPVEIWHSERINSRVLDIAVYGDYVYLALDNGGLMVYSTYSGAPLAGIWIETPELPHLIVGAGTLYAHTTNNVLVYSLSQPTAPQVIADLPYPEGVNDIAWDSSQLAVGLNTGLTILNVLDPASPQWQEHYPSTAIRELTSGSNRIYAVTTDNTFDLYLLASGIGLKFFSHYQLPVYVSFLRILSAIGDAFYVYTQDDYGASGIGPSIYRAQVPLAPTLDFVSDLDFPNSAPEMVIGGTFGVAISHDRLVVYDFPSPDYPTLQSQQFAMDFEGRDADFNDSETDLYVANNKDGIARISVPTPGSMAQVARQATPGIALGIAHHAGYVYVADDTAGARIYNENLALQSVIPFQGAMDVALSGNYLYVANSEVFEDGYVSGVYVYNITNPSAPVLVSTLPIEADMSRKLEIQGNYLYLSGSKLHIIDISNPASPQDVAQLTTVGKNYGMTVSGNLLFLTHTYGVNFRGGFSVIDITNPLLPQQLAYEEMTGTHVGEVVYKAPYLYFRVGDFQTGTSGLFIYDVSIPAAPCEAGYYRSDFGWGLAINQIGETPHIYLFEGGIVKVLGLNMPAGPYTIAGSVTTSGGGLPNALVSVGPGRTSLTNAEGNYSITNLPACRYSVAPQKNRYSFSPNKQEVDPSLFDTSSVNFSATLTTPYQISGLVRNASDQPLSGVTITDGTGPSVTTGADGSYTFTGLEPGQHTLTPTYPDMTFIPTSLIVTLDDLDLEGQNFIGSAGNFSLSGIISSDGGFPVEGVTVTDGAGRTTLTGEDGRYSFEGLPPGAYTITPTKTGYGFSPAFLSVTLNTASAAGQNFTGLRSAPTALQLSKNTLAEHQLVGTPIGRLTTSDPNEGDTFTYQFVDSDPACDGSDNSRFLLEWANADVMELRANQIFDYELDNSFNICIRSIDSTYRSIQQSFTISIYDLPEKEPHLLWNTFNRGGNVRNMVTDAQGNIYVTGSTTRGWGVPVSPYTGGEEIYVGKYLPDGTLAWNTFFGHGDPGYDRATGIFLKPSGNLIILGYSSNHWGSPVPNPTGGTNDTVVFELDASGNLLWHTYIGGNMGMRSEDLQVDGAGNIYFTAYSQYDWGAPINPHNGTNTDIAVVKLSPTGSLLWNTFVGGDGQDDSKSLRLDESGNLYTIGYSFGTPNGSFLYMLDNQGNLLSSRPLGGGNFLRLEVDSDAFYIYGNGCAPNHHTPGISSYSGVAKYSLAGEMQWCTHLGGGVTFNYDAVLDKARNRIHLAGLSEGTWGEPAIAYAGGINDAQISTLDMETGDILFYTFLGGLNEDRAESIAVDPSGDLLIGGYSKATWGAPINAFTSEDAVNAWVAKLSLDTVAPTGIGLSKTSVFYKAPVNTVVGQFTASDPDASGPYTYTLVIGEGAENNGAFTISGDQLLTAQWFSTISQTTTASIRVRVTDGTSRYYETPFTITIQRSYDCQSVTEIPEVECRALEALYNSTYGSNWIQQGNWLVNNSPCSWYGVTCLNNHVSSIELGNNNLGGTIPAELGNLSALTHLTLTSNQIGGSIPPELGQLSSLVSLDLRDNQIYGGIPAQLGSLSHLEWLNLSENFVTGNIPPELGNLSQLDMLSLAYSQITGSIPPEIGNLVRLRYLRLGYNPISGSIPPEIGNMTNLSEIYLRGTLINGQLPSQLNALPNLTSLDVAYTQLSGPAFIMDGLSGFWFEGTSMCEPDEPAFSAWKAQVESWGTTGTICPDTRVYTVSGSVTDVATHTPLAGVTISDGQGHTATTGADGQLTLTGLLAGNYTFTASKTGYLFTPPSITVTVGGGSSVVLNFTGQALNPVPVLGSVEPGSHQVDGTPLELTINGIGFVPGSVLRWNGTSVPTQYFSSSLLRATIDTSAIHQDQTASLVIYSPGPGGGVSNTISFTVYLPKTPEVQPMLLCVTETGANTYTATFNYTNLAKRVVSIPSGENNYFSPAPTFRGQPVTFQVDPPAAGFSVDFDGQSLTWHLDGLLVTASSASPRCAAPEPDPFSLSKVSPDHAKFGPQNDINIHGEGLQAGTNVYLLNACPVPLDQVPPSAVKMVGQFLNDKHIRATVPGAKPVGSYAILAANPDGALACLANAYSIWPDDKHDFYADAGDFWSSPAVLRANSKADLGLVLHRFNGGGPASDVIIRFYLGEKDAGGQLIGETQVDLIEKNNAKASPTVTWAVPAETGAYTLYAYIDPDNHFADELDKNNNIIRRQVVVETSPQDTTPPEVVSFTSKDGRYVSQTSVSLQVDARDTGPDPVSGVQSIYLYEYEYNQPAAEWVQVQASGWIDLPKSGALHWELLPTSGLHYLKIWASDRAGNISALPGSLLLNYQPGKGKLAQGLLHLYRQELTAGETLRLDLTSTTGDADIYLWGPDNTLVASSLLTSTLESITYQAVKGGMYQIEVFGYSSTDYELEITRSAPVLLALPAFAGAAPLVLTAGKALPAAPVIALNNVPPDQAVLPYPERKYNVFMPSVWK